ncbi:MAG: response regulator [Polyangiaceae bacterium]|nr:response regulator [Polyangiaceae bacterium]
MASSPFDLMRALARLARRLTEEHTSTLLPDALDLLLTGSGCTYGAIYLLDTKITPMAVRLPQGNERHAEIRQTVTALAEEAMTLLKARVVPDLLHAAPPIPGAAVTALVAQGALSLPIEHGRVAAGAVVLLANDEPALGAERVAFVEAATHAIGLAVHRDRGAELERLRREEMEEANRMAGLGLLTASVAHELRGPVAALQLQLEEQRRLLREAEGSGGDVSPMLLSELHELNADLDTALGRVRNTVEQLARLSRRESQPAELDLAHVVRDALEATRPYLRRRGIQVVEHLDPALGTIGRRDNLGQVLLNLVLNAADACEQVPNGDRTIVVSVGPDADRAVLQVDDSGPGLPANAIRTIFTPFFTTKQRGKGTGLGLKICADVVTAHGGHIEVTNRPQGGASFRVLLPRRAPPSTRPPPSPRRSAPAVRSRILVIDDDPVFLRTVTRGLKEIIVDTALTASEGELLFGRPDYRPDLVLCDLHLPGLNGHDLHARIAARDSDLAARFVFCTGGALSPAEAAYLRESGCPTLFKPLNLDDIREMVSEPAESFNQAQTLARFADPR